MQFFLVRAFTHFAYSFPFVVFYEFKYAVIAITVSAGANRAVGKVEGAGTMSRVEGPNASSKNVIV